MATSVSSCSACDSQDLDQSIDGIASLCMACGFVIHDAENPRSPWWTDNEANELYSDENTEEWLDFCRITNATEKRVALALNHLEEISCRLDIGKEIREQTAEIYCAAVMEEITNGRDTKRVMRVSLRLASQLSGNPIPIDRIQAETSEESSQFRQVYLKICEELNLSPNSPKPSDYLDFIESQLRLSDDQIRHTNEILEMGGRSDIVGKNPAGVAAAATYIACEEITQAEVAETVGVSTETIRKRVHDLRGEQ